MQPGARYSPFGTTRPRGAYNGSGAMEGIFIVNGWSQKTKQQAVPTEKRDTTLNGLPSWGLAKRPPEKKSLQEEKREKNFVGPPENKEDHCKTPRIDRHLRDGRSRPAIKGGSRHPAQEPAAGAKKKTRERCERCRE